MTEIPAPYGPAPQSDFPSQYRRVFEAAGCRSQVELAAFLGIRQSSVSDTKRREAVPVEWLITLLRRKSVHPEWILTGLGSKFLRPAAGGKNVGAARPATAKLPKECSTQELVTELVRRALADMQDSFLLFDIRGPGAASQ